MTDKKKPSAPIPLCRFEELAERENRLREQAGEREKRPPHNRRVKS
jgi:hypothetical protein